MHDARATPYSLIFEHELFEDRFFPAIADEAEARGGDVRSFESFVGLEQVTELLGRLLPESDAGGPESAAALAKHAKLLYQAFHYWRSDGCVYAVAPDLARRLLASANWRMRPGRIEPPAPSGYVQLPPNLIWARVEEDAPPEPVDGFFWTCGVDAYEGGDRLELVFALGVRAGRPGVTLIDVGRRLDDDAAHAWEAQRGRAAGDDFANILPGGELNDLRALETEAEALKLAARWFDALASGAAVLEPLRGVVHAQLADG